jgi:hypothetical protein
MVNLIIQKKKRKKKQVHNYKKFSLLRKSSGVIPLASNPGIGAWYSELCGEGCCPSCQTVWGGDGWRVFSFFFSLLPLFLWVIC